MGGDLKVSGLGQQITNLLQIGFIGGAIVVGAGVVTVPLIQFCLHLVANLKELGIAWHEVIQDVGQALPENSRLYPCSWSNFINQQVMQGAINL